MTEPAINTVVPYLHVTSPDACIAFLAEVFDAVLLVDKRHNDGSLQHARVRISNSVLMLAAADQSYTPTAFRFHIVVPDVDAAVDRAERAGATLVMPANRRPHGAWMAGVEDPWNTTWWIANRA